MAFDRIFRIPLFWRLALFFGVLLTGLTLVYARLGLHITSAYSMEVNQQLGRGIAEHTVQEIKPFVDGQVDEGAAHDIMHAMMAINPDVEVYLLDPKGEILQYVAPYKEVKLERVDLEPVLQYLADSLGQAGLILGDDPREPGKTNVFSAAPVLEQGRLQGYVYIILASQAYTSAADALMGSYVLRNGRNALGIVLGLSLLLSLAVAWGMSRPLNRIARAMQRFRGGALEARTGMQGQSGFARLGENFDAMADTIERNVENLRSVESLRQELVANVSHDLRTPVTAISGYAETLLLQEEQLSPEDRKRYLETIVRSSDKLNKRVQDLFALSKLESRQAEWKPEPVQLSDLVQDIAAQYQLIARNHGIAIHTLISAQPPLVEADISLLDRVFQNILDNAIRHCSPGDSVSIEIHPREASVRVRIADTGEGIPEAQLPHVFDRFQRSARNGGGSGLGLAIVRRIIELHEAEIHVESQRGQGTAFWFDLPLAG